METALSLYQLNLSIKETIEEAYPYYYWVVAEIGEFRLNQNGHCYLELIEKDENRIIAKNRATIWSRNYSAINLKFTGQTGGSLQQGIKVLMNVSVAFHELYGFSLDIIDIDPSYTLGDQAKKRTEIINKLIEDGVYEMNKEHELPLVCHNIAIISAPTAAGYEDFVNQLDNNSNKYYFNCKLFKALMQGDDTANSIISALNKINDESYKYDAVVIIRGGGSKSDLSYFDDYELACNVAQFPLPIFIGIGHERDETVLDFIANKSFKTPTAVAEFIIDLARNVDNQLNNLYYDLKTLSLKIINSHNNYLNSLSKNIVYLANNSISLKKKTLDNMSNILKINTINLLNNNKQKLDFSSKNLIKAIENRLLKEKNKIQLYESIINSNSPEKILKRGYSLTVSNNKIIKSVDDIKNDDIIETLTYDGRFKSKVIEKIKKHTDEK